MATSSTNRLTDGKYKSKLLPASDYEQSARKPCVLSLWYVTKVFLISLGTVFSSYAGGYSTGTGRVNIFNRSVSNHLIPPFMHQKAASNEAVFSLDEKILSYSPDDSGLTIETLEMFDPRESIDQILPDICRLYEKKSSEKEEIRARRLAKNVKGDYSLPEETNPVALQPAKHDQNPANVINMSFGWPDPCPVVFQEVFDQLISKGITLIAAAGNDGPQARDYTPSNCHGVITVAETISPELLSLWSNSGEIITLSAVTDIPLISNNGTKGPEKDTRIHSYGTSISSALVSQAAALISSANPDLLPADIRYILQRSSDPFNTDEIEDMFRSLNDQMVIRINKELHLISENRICDKSRCGAGNLNCRQPEKINDFNV